MEKIDLEEKKNLIELKYKVLSQRIDRLYYIFTILAQDEKQINAILVIKEQYEKMYNALLEREAYDKYEEVENTVIPKLAQIENQLDKHIYRTYKNCEELIEGYIKTLSSTDNSLNNMLARIKAIKEILKLYGPYINQQLNQTLEYKISEFKFIFLIREQIKGMTRTNIAGTGSLFSHCDSKKEKDIFRELTKVRFKREVEDCVDKISEAKKDANAEWIMGYETAMSGILKEEIHKAVENYKKRVNQICPLIKFLYKIEKVSGEIDLTKEYETVQAIEAKYYIMHEQVLNGQYGKFLEIQSNIIPYLEELERKLDTHIKKTGRDKILNNVCSKKYMVLSILEPKEDNPKDILINIMKMKNDYIPTEDARYDRAINMYKDREYLRDKVLSSDDYYLWYVPQSLGQLLDVPIFDKEELGYTSNNVLCRKKDELKFKCQYLNELTNGKHSISNWIALERFFPEFKRRYRINTKGMTYQQKLIWTYFMNTNIRPKDAYYLIELDEEAEVSVSTLYLEHYWPVDGKEFYKLPNFSDLSTYDLKKLHVRTKRLLVLGKKLELPLDETKMKEISEEEAMEIQSRIREGDYIPGTNEIVDNIFNLWPETEENTVYRKEMKEKIIHMVIKRANREHIPDIECIPLYQAIINYVNRTRLSFNNYRSCAHLKKDWEKMAHLIDFVEVFLKIENEKEYQKFWSLARDIDFERSLIKQIEDILYCNGERSGFYSYFSSYDGDNERFFKYFGDRSKVGKGYIYDEKVNSTILEDMRARPEKYLFVLQAPKENSIVPKETRELIEQSARRIELEAMAVEER